MRYIVLAMLCAALILVPQKGANGIPGTLVTEVTSPRPDGLVTSVTSFDAATNSNGQPLNRTAAWPFSRIHARPLYELFPAQRGQHPAVARIIVPERDATAYGSGTLVDVRDQYGLVITNWHVVGDAHGTVEVVFPSGFRSHARPLKVDSDWDLAALVIWRPPIEPVKVAPHAPRQGDPLTIHGYGQGQYRIATGRCTNYYAPRPNYPLEMVELDVEARQGDSGGPIFNQRGELAGVLFGAGQGTTLGSFAPRVSTFLATLAPDIGQASDQALVAIADRPAPNVGEPTNRFASAKAELPTSTRRAPDSVPLATPDGLANLDGLATSVASNNQSAPPDFPADSTLTWHDLTGNGWYDSAKSALALVGLFAIALRLIKSVH